MRLSRKKEQDYGEPLYNLTIELVLDQITFPHHEDNYEHGIDNLIKMGLACEIAKKHFSEGGHVTEKGYFRTDYMISSISEYIPEYKAKLNINSNSEAIIFLQEVINRSQVYTYDSPKVKLLYEDGTIQYVKADEKGLYLPFVREKLSFREGDKIE